MADFHSPALADGGFDLLRTRAATTGRIQVWLLPSYTLGDSYATCNAAKAASASLTAGDIVAAGAAGSTRTQTVAAKSTTLSATVSSGVLSTLHQVLVDTTTSEVLLATNVPVPIDTGTGVAATGSLASGSAFTTSVMTYSQPMPT